LHPTGLPREWAHKIKHGCLHAGSSVRCFWPRSNTPFNSWPPIALSCRAVGPRGFPRPTATLPSPPQAHRGACRSLTRRRGETQPSLAPQLSLSLSLSLSLVRRFVLTLVMVVDGRRLGGSSSSFLTRIEAWWLLGYGFRWGLVGAGLHDGVDSGWSGKPKLYIELACPNWSGKPKSTNWRANYAAYAGSVQDHSGKYVLSWFWCK
jgi:hypothetical protein